MTILKLKVVKLPALDDAVSVSVAEVELLVLKMWLSRFHAKFMYWVAFDGAQFKVVMLKVTGIVPMFFT